jgi:RNA polymerase sigma-70 factor (ECF subfamily)
MIPMALTAPPLPATEVALRSPVMDEAAFQSLYQRTAQPLRGYLRRASGDPALADDLLQECYLRFLRSSFVGEDAGHERHYLFRIASNLLVDHFRRGRRATEELTEVATPAHHHRDIELRTDVGRALAGLSDRDRQMLWLAYVEGSSHDEIALALGLKTASLKSMLSRARARLAERLRAIGFPPSPEEL